MKRPQIPALLVVLGLVLLAPFSAKADRGASPAQPSSKGIVPIEPYGAGYYYRPGTIASLCQGQTGTIPVDLVNYGTLTWDPSDFHLSYHWYSGTNEIVFDGLRTTLPKSVGPREQVSVQAQVKAPDTPGSYTLKWDMVQEGVTWFSWQGVATRDETVPVLSVVECLVRNASAANLSPPPKITGPVPMGTAEPGLFLFVTGSDFGTVPGKLLLRLTDFWGGDQQYNIDQIGSWTDTAVFATVPDDITGVQDQKGTVQVVTSGGRLSNTWVVSFTAKRDLGILPPIYVQYNCSSKASNNECQNTGDLYPGNECSAGLGVHGTGPSYQGPPPLFWGPTMTGAHGSWYIIGGQDGIDDFAVQLKNGWVVDSFSFRPYNNGGNVSEPTGITPEDAFQSIHVSWSTDWCGSVEYDIDLYITGPVGVPYQ